jgi:hypothetical protein
MWFPVQPIGTPSTMFPGAGTPRASKFMEPGWLKMGFSYIRQKSNIIKENHIKQVFTKKILVIQVTCQRRFPAALPPKSTAGNTVRQGIDNLPFMENRTQEPALCPESFLRKQALPAWVFSPRSIPIVAAQRQTSCSAEIVTVQSATYPHSFTGLKIPACTNL